MSTVPGERAKSSGKRSRIVVNIEQLPPEDRSAAVKGWQGKFRARRVKGRRRRIASLGAVVLAAFALVLVAGVYLWWGSFKSRPAYTLALAIEAAERDDRAAFEQLVDVDEISRSLVPQVIERVNGQQSGGASNIPAQVRRQIAQNAQVWLPGLREQVREVLMTETRALADKNGAQSYPFFVRALALSRLGESTTQGAGRDASATVTYKVNERPLEFGLRGADGSSSSSSSATATTTTAAASGSSWKVVSLKSDELAAQVAAQVAKKFPMTGR